MSDNSETLRRSTRIRTKVNLSDNEETFTPSKTSRVTRTPSTRTRSRKNSGSDESQPTTPAKTLGGTKRGRPRKSSGTEDEPEPNPRALKEELEKELETIEEDVQKPKELFDDEDVSGNKMYGFQTPSRKNGMAQKALQSRTPARSETPRSRAARVLLHKIDDDIVTKSPAAKSILVKNSTRIPEIKKRQVYFPSDSESVSEDSEYIPSNDEDDDEEVEDEENETAENSLSDNENSDDGSPRILRKGLKRKVPVPITPCRRGRSKNNIQYKDFHLKTDEYFSIQAEKVLTSDRTLNRLKTPRLNEEKLQELLSNQNHISRSHKAGIQELTNGYRSMFPMWCHVMEEGYSILLHGLGSKRTLINDFHREIIADHPTLVVNGFFPSLTIKDVLDGIITELLGLDAPSNANECFNIIEETLKKNPEDKLYLLVHNIDGAMLRNSKAQDILSRLAAMKNVRLLASVDHINAPLIWDNVKRSRYNFYWWDATTLLPYEAETSYESSLMVQQSGALALSSLHNVFASLTTNAKAIYIILVKHQIENSTSNLYPGMAFKDLYRGAREGFLVSSDFALRAQLTEFIDHKLVKTRRNVEGAEYLVIPLNNSLLKKFLEEHGNE
ncbi:origin recognition complex subunit 2 [Fopius arisanus]|uniref:Origin recognition complex subunit 2 n=1 Tax=Fopius arisanus TaxID=64838 RepID=A0A9R1T5W1_9HYME|nr:PREDICTED: origin recognition complex subunit 2 [Fopius arisanus]